MPDFNKRSYQKEILDIETPLFNDVKKAMKELDFINTWLGGHAITRQGFKKLLQDRKDMSVCEIGCGGGNNLAAIKKWCMRNNVKATFTGIDINENCIEYAIQQNREMEFIFSDYQQVSFERKQDIIFSSLFCHHFTDEELIGMMQWMKANSTVGFFINDLHRHPVAYYFIKLTTKLLSGSYLVKNDGPISVLRAFKKKDWKHILERAGIRNYSIKWKWAFRYLIVLKNDG
jgi:2-polyprenyl-3-methyl-5-hydroxy-6-metoxy-1,4-benzoquinol methylase